jgi:hypothetical protein
MSNEMLPSAKIKTVPIRPPPDPAAISYKDKAGKYQGQKGIVLPKL